MSQEQKIMEIKRQIDELKLEHQQVGDDLDDYKDSDIIEHQAKQLIRDYCIDCGYMINGFPHKMMEQGTEEVDEDYFSNERYGLYLDSLTLIKDDVAELQWYLTKTFWPDTHDSKGDYLEELKELLDSGVLYEDISL